MKSSRRLKIGVLGTALILVAYFLIVNHQTPVRLETVDEVNAQINSLKNISEGNYSWNVSASFVEGDIICGLVLEPLPSSEGISWLNILEPIGPVTPYGYINYPHIFVYLELYNGDNLVSKVEMVWVNDPEASPPVNAHLYVYNMSYVYANETAEPKYHYVETVGTWVVLTPDGAPENGTYTLKVFAFGAIPPPDNVPPSRIALGKRLIGYPYTYFLALGIFSSICGVSCVVISIFPGIIERKKKTPRRPLRSSR